ncbi:MAG: hybrid sensor histidine kinase/response regulator [Myxococcota bacterium]
MKPDDELIAGAAHDIANALSAVLGWVELARQGARSEEALDAIETAARAARTTAQLLLGDVDNETPADLGAVATAVGRLVAPEARKRGVGVEVSAKPTITRLGQAAAFRCLWNLTLNAVQATPRGGLVRVTVDGGAQGTFRVEDNGPGMDLATQRKVLEGGFTSREDGHGLGVGIVRRLVENAGGRLSVASTPGSGTSFRAVVPLAGQRSKAVSGVRRRGLAQRVLIVEDDDGVREMVVTALTVRGVDAVGVASFGEVERLPTGSFDIALVDLTLGDASGIEVIQYLREHHIAKEIVLASGASEPYLPPASRPDRWLRKPFDADQLLEVIATSPTREATG